MAELRYTLLADGSSDRALIEIISWLLRQHLPGVALVSQWADLGRLPRPPRSLAERIVQSARLHPCDLLFIHRDAEREPRQVRVDQVRRALADAATLRPLPPAIPVVPVRMTEAWLLSNEAAIRRVARNPNGRQPLALPDLRALERLPDPKGRLRQLIQAASGRPAHRLRRLNVGAIQVAAFTATFSSLRGLPAFQALEAELESLLQEQDWATLPGRHPSD